MADLLKFGLTADKTQATVTPAAETPTVSAAQVERAIHELANLRHAMLPPVPANPPQDALARVVPNCSPILLPEIGDAGVLQLRNTGQGWQCFRLERSELEELQRSIASILARPKLTPQ